MTLLLVAIGIVGLILAGWGGWLAWTIIKRDDHWYYKAAVKCYKKRDFLQARKLLVQCLKKNTTYANAWYTLGLIAQQEKRLENALTYYERALEYTPEDTYSLFNKGQVLLEKRDFEAAKATFEELLELDGDDPDAVYALAVCQQEMGDNTRELIGKVLTLNQRHPEGNFKMGNFLVDDGEFFQASNHYQITLEEDQEYTPAYIEMASCKAKLQEWQECIEVCQKGTLRDPTNPRLYNQLGLAHFYIDQPENAIRYYRLAIQMDPTYYLAYNNLGYALEGHGNITEAIEAFQYYMQYVRGTPAAKETLDHIRDLEHQHNLTRSDDSTNIDDSVTDEYNPEDNTAITGESITNKAAGNTQPSVSLSDRASAKLPSDNETSMQEGNRPSDKVKSSGMSSSDFLQQRKAMAEAAAKEEDMGYVRPKDESSDAEPSVETVLDSTSNDSDNGQETVETDLPKDDVPSAESPESPLDDATTTDEPPASEPVEEPLNTTDHATNEETSDEADEKEDEPLPDDIPAPALSLSERAAAAAAAKAGQA